jgi:hypothetical protein
MLDYQGSGLAIPGRVGNSLLLQSVDVGILSHPAFWPVATRRTKVTSGKLTIHLH